MRRDEAFSLAKLNVTTLRVKGNLLHNSALDCSVSLVNLVLEDTRQRSGMPRDTSLPRDTTFSDVTSLSGSEYSQQSATQRIVRLMEAKSVTLDDTTIADKMVTVK